MAKTSKDNERGAALIFTILILFILSVLGTALISVAVTNFTLTKRGSDYNTVYYLADGAAEEIAAEMQVLADNAEFYSLSVLEAHAEAIGESHVSSFTVDDATFYTFDLPGFKDDLEDAFEDAFLNKIAESLEEAVLHVSFNPSFNDNFDEENPLAVDIVYPNPFNASHLSDGAEIHIKVSGAYSNLKRSILIAYVVHVPSYAFEASEAATSISYDGFKRNNAEPGLEMVSWEESNIND